MLDPGTQINGYTVEAFLDEGGMARVYEVRHDADGTRHAVKLLYAKDEDTRRRLLAEGRMLTEMAHPNIVPVTDVITHQGRPGLVMELVEGLSLDQWMNEKRRPWKDREAVFLGILEGLAYAHGNGIIHRDLQPANILIGKDADGNIMPRIIDFGLAKMVGYDGTTRTGSTLGTPGYMAPEQIRDSKNIDSRADMFALGCLLYVLVCEREPFDGKDNLEVFNNTAHGKYPNPAQVAARDVNHVYLRAIEGCLRVSKDDRIPHAQALLGVLEGDELSPRTDEHTLVDFDLAAKKKRKQMMMLGGLGLAGLSVIAVSLWVLLSP